MSNHQSSQGAGRLHPTDQQRISDQPPHRRRSRRSPPQTTTARYGTTAKLMAMVDDHIAWTAQTKRPTSKGTMIVDWDGSGEPVITYRKKEPEIPAPVPAPAPLRTASQTRVPIQASPQAQAPSSRVPAPGRQNPSAYKRKPLLAIPSVTDSMRELHQHQRKPAAPPSYTRYDSVVSQARGASISKPLPLPPQPSSQAPPAPRQSAPPAQNPNKHTTPDGFTATYCPPRFSTSLNAPKPGYVRGYDTSS